MNLSSSDHWLKRQFRDCINGSGFALLVVATWGMLNGASALATPPACPSTKTATTSSPRLNVILPRGVQRGGEYEFTFSGERLKDAEEIFYYDSGMSTVSITPVDNNNIKVKIKVAEDCRLGEHVVQVRTQTGISDYRSIFIGPLQEANESEPNSEFDAAQVIPRNVTVNGTITGEDVDYFAIEAKKGERISVEIEAIRLGAMFDSFISILDENRFELAVSDDTPLLQQDGIASIVVPQDGTYRIMVRESSYGGNGNCRYRLHVGTFPRPTIAYPAGGKPGTQMKVRFYGDPLGPIEREIEVPATKGFRNGLFVEDETGITPSPIPFQLIDLENVLEVEPNNSFPDQPAATAPVALNGIIGQEKDYDYLKFSAKKGQVFDVECFARRIGSGLDPVMNIFRASNKQHVVGDDDARRPDCYIRFTAPEDDDYYVRIRDHLGRGQDDFVYRVEIRKPTPSINFTIPRVDRYSQQRQSIAVPRGNRFATQFNAARTNFGGELQLLSDNLPAGIKMTAFPMRSDLNVVPVVFEADSAAELTGGLIDFIGRHVDESKNIRGSFSNLADFALGVPNNARYYGCPTDKLPIAIVEKLPFKLDIVQPKVPLVRDGSMQLKIVATRDEGFDGPIRIQFPFRPTGLGTTYQVEMKKGQSEVYYPLNANGGARLGQWPVYAIGWGESGGPAWASTQMAKLDIAEPFVRMTINKVVCERGSSAEMVCKLEQKTPFEGEAKAELLGLPPNITSSPVTFTKDTAELKFPIATNEKSPIGKHKSPFCRVTIIQNGEPVVFTAGRTSIQVTKPVPPKKDDIASASEPTASTGEAPKK